MNLPISSDIGVAVGGGSMASSASRTLALMSVSVSVSAGRVWRLNTVERKRVIERVRSFIVVFSLLSSLLKLGATFGLRQGTIERYIYNIWYTSIIIPILYKSRVPVYIGRESFFGLISSF